MSGVTDATAVQGTYCMLAWQCSSLSCLTRSLIELCRTAVPSTSAKATWNDNFPHALLEVFRWSALLKCATRYSWHWCTCPCSLHSLLLFAGVFCGIRHQGSNCIVGPHVLCTIGECPSLSQLITDQSLEYTGREGPAVPLGRTIYLFPITIQRILTRKENTLSLWMSVWHHRYVIGDLHNS